LADRSLTSDILSIYVPSFFIFLGMSIVSPILPIYAESFNVDYTMVSLAISIYALGRLIVDLPVGVIADKFGRRPLMIFGTLILTICSFLNASAPNFAIFLLYRFIEGVGSAMWMTSRTTLLADILKPHERGRVMSYFQSFMLIGSAAGPTVGGIIAVRWGIQAPFYFYALAGGISLALTIFLVKEPDNSQNRHHEGSHFSIPVIKRLLTNRSYMMACLATLTAFFLMTGIRSTIIPLYANTELKLGEEQIGLVLSAATVMNLLMTVPIGYGLDYYGRKPIIVVSIILAALACSLFPFTTSFLTIVVASVVLGIGTSGAQQAPLAMASDATINEPHGLSMGVYRFFGDMGYVIGPIILGLIADRYGLKLPFFFMTGLMLISGLLVFFLAKETFSRRIGEKPIQTPAE